MPHRSHDYGGMFADNLPLTEHFPPIEAHPQIGSVDAQRDILVTPPR